MQDHYAEAFQLVLEEARQTSGISDIERADFYEPLKGKIYELLHDGRTDLGKVADEALSWLRQNVQVNQSLRRVQEQ
jgi:hypothetical protein